LHVVIVEVGPIHRLDGSFQRVVGTRVDDSVLGDGSSHDLGFDAVHHGEPSIVVDRHVVAALVARHDIDRGCAAADDR